MSTTTADRRTLLGSLAATALGPGLPAPAAAAGFGGAAASVAAVMAELMALPGFGSLAAACARALPDERGAEAVIMELAGRAYAAGLDGAGPEAVKAWLAGEVRADFAAGDVLEVDGWRLARTEVRLGAAAARLAASS
jgi:hypothetical protein